ncbi:MAG TPA: RnfABCDGE type electron transport complex subunit A [Spirochaetota bacterium]|nr:RnfABCDGE type electron transport complex subunit A [Spirochaetota bacterium]HOM38619.1 RnfABCDGE type electron transport complex subunit A [Spirochaetota bacterium]HPQ49756.1 RnfABCDGE type electron transport complex subunit A [Spirochaetota bacterium]
MIYFYIFISSIFVNNFILSRFLGLCPFIGVSKRLSASFGMGIAVTFVMTIAGAISYLEFNFILKPLKIEFLDTIVFILTIASTVQLLEMLLQKYVPFLYNSLGIFLPLITTNCAVLGVSQLNILYDYNFLEALVFDFSSGLGFTLAIILMAGIREKLEFGNVPRSFRGVPIAFIVASLMSLAFLGFSNLVKINK